MPRLPPHFTVSAIVKSTGEKGPVGVAWRTPEGNIRIKLNSFVVLHGGDDLSITCFDREVSEKKFGPKSRKAIPPETPDEGPAF